jgi:hypothetical protein
VDLYYGDGLIAGMVIGFLLDYFVFGRKSKRVNTRKKQAEVLLLIVCPDYLMGRIESIIWDNFALGVAKVKR